MINRKDYVIGLHLGADRTVIEISDNNKKFTVFNSTAKIDKDLIREICTAVDLAYSRGIIHQAVFDSELRKVAKAAIQFEKNSYDYPHQDDFFVSDQKKFLYWQRKVKEVLEELKSEYLG